MGESEAGMGRREPGAAAPRADADLRRGLKLLLATAALVAAGLLVWSLAQVLLLVFGAVLVAVLLDAMAAVLCRRTPLGRGVSLALAGLLVLAVLAGFLVLFGAQLQAQLAELAGRLPELAAMLENRLGIEDLEGWAADRLREMLRDGGIASRLAGISSNLLGALANLGLVIVAGVYLAARPELYRDGLLLLFPPAAQQRARATLDAVGRALRLWLLGQLVAMLMVGVLTALGLWLLGIPSALALGFIAGLLEFVPYLGPILGALPALLLALAESPSLVLWVVLLYAAVQQVEGNLITPLVQQRAVDMPPALTIFAILAFGVLFGLGGVLLATPLAVVLMVMVKTLWVRDTLHRETSIPGERRRRGGN